MKSYDCDYTWEDVAKAGNKCLNAGILSEPNENPLKNIYSNDLSLVLDKIAHHIFIYGYSSGDFNGLTNEINLLREALVQLHKIGYIGQGNNDDE